MRVIIHGSRSSNVRCHLRQHLLCLGLLHRNGGCDIKNPCGPILNEFAVPEIAGVSHRAASSGVKEQAHEGVSSFEAWSSSRVLARPPSGEI